MATLDAQRVRELLHGDAFMFTSGIGGTGVVGVSANGSGPAVLLLARALTPIGGLTMRIRKHPLTPLAAVTAGLLAGAVGTVCLERGPLSEVPPRRQHWEPARLGVRAGRQLGDGPRPGAGRPPRDRGLHPA